MILPIKLPYLCSFSQNSIDFGVKTDLLYQTSTALPFLKLDFLIKPTLGDFFRIEFNNPETAERITIDFVAVDGSDPANYSELWQIPDTSFSGSLRDLRNIFFEKLRQRAMVNAWFNIELPIIEFGGSIPWIRLTAKEARPELVMEFSSNQSTSPTKRISEELSAAYYLPWERDGYQLKASLYMETAYNSNNYELITVIDAVPDKDGIAYVDVSKFLNDAIESGWDEYPVPYEQQNGYKAQNLRKYYLEFAETFTGESNVFTWKSDVYFVHWGGSNADDQYSGDMVARVNQSGQYLTWWPSGKRLKKEQDDWLAYMNGPTVTTFDVVATVVTDEENEITVHEAITLQPFETFVWNTGFDANNFANEIPLGQKLRFWRWGLNFGCEDACEPCIKVSFFALGNFYEFDVVKSGTKNGFNTYDAQNSPGHIITIYYNEGWVLFISFLGQARTYLSEYEGEIPYTNDWTVIFGSSFFEEPNITESNVTVCDKKVLSYNYEGNTYTSNMINIGVRNGFPNYMQRIGDNTITIYWNIVIWSVYNDIPEFYGGSENLLGEYEVNEESGVTNVVFSEFVAICQLANQFTYYPESSCFTQTILFFNSFGIPETFLVSAEFQQNLTTSKELATRTQSYALTNILPQNYIFDVSNVISYQAQTLALTNNEAERLMPLLNTAIAFLQKNNAWQPIIISAGTLAIFKVNQFLQNISLELVAANEQKSISFFENKPDFEVVFFGGVYSARLKKNGLRITDFGSIVATRLDNGATLGTLNFIPQQNIYLITPAIQYEGLIKMTLTCEVKGVEVVTEKVVKNSWDSIEMVFFATSGNMDFNMDWSAFTSTPYRIDYGDSTVDTGNITSTTTSQDHTYLTTGKKIIKIFCPNFGNVTLWSLNDGGNFFDFGKFRNLSNLAVYNGTRGKYYLTTPNYQIINFQNTPLQGLNIGFQRNITSLTLSDTSINSDALDVLLTEIWNFRKGYNNAWDVYLVNLGYTVSDYADAIINGTGQFAGDGLVDNGIDVNIV